MSHAHLYQLLLFLAGTLLVAKIAAHLAHRVGQPAVLGELLVGLLIGPSALDLLGLPFFHAHSPELLDRVITDLAEIGVILLMFVAGLETDMAMMRRVGRAAFWAAVGGVALPMAGGILVSRLFGLSWPVSVFAGTVLTATSVSISAQTLMELRQLQSKEGTTIIGSAFIDDILGLIVLSLVIAFSTSGTVSLVSMSWLLLKITLFLVVATLLGLRLLPGLTRAIGRLHATEGVLAVSVAVCFLYAWGAEHLGGIAAISGAYLAGALLATSAFREELTGKLEVLTYGFFVPVFFVHIGLETNIRVAFADGATLAFALVVLLVAIALKALGCAAGTLAGGFTWLESLRVGVGMVSRGEVALITVSIGRTAGLVSDRVFAVMILMTLVTTLITPILLRLAFRPAAPAAGLVAGRR